MSIFSFILVTVSIFFGGFGAFIITHCGRKLALLDTPNSRSSHDRVTPKGGGIGILAAFVVSSIVVKIPTMFWVPATMLSLVSFLDDKYEISARLRLLIQFVAAFFFLNSFEFFNGSILFLINVQHLFIFGLCSIFIVGTANCYNFMDGINGISGVTGIMAFGMLGLYGLLMGKDIDIVHICFTIMAACIGFLPFNFPKARVFMGDIGAILLGFLFACIVVVFSKNLQDFIILVSFLFPFYIDEVITQIERFRRSEKLMKAHRSHLYQVLANENNIVHWRVSLGYGVVQFIVGLSVWRISCLGVIPSVVLLFIYTSCFAAFNWKVKTITNSTFPVDS